MAQLCPDPWGLWSRDGSQRLWGEQATSLGMASSREKSHQDFWCRIRCFQSYRQFSDVFCETSDQDSVPRTSQSQHQSPSQGTVLCSDSPFTVNPQSKIAILQNAHFTGLIPPPLQSPWAPPDPFQPHSIHTPSSCSCIYPRLAKAGCSILACQLLSRDQLKLANPTEQTQAQQKIHHLRLAAFAAGRLPGSWVAGCMS